MAGVIFRVLKKTRFDFSNQGANSELIQFFSDPHNGANYREGKLVVRVHGGKDITSGTGGPSIVVRAIAAAPTEEDPGLFFGMTGGPAALATVTINASTDTPSGDVGTMLAENLTDKFGGWLIVLVKGIQQSSVGTCKATLSVDLVLKE
jgi:hypothetical protein